MGQGGLRGHCRRWHGHRGRRRRHRHPRARDPAVVWVVIVDAVARAGTSRPGACVCGDAAAAAVSVAVSALHPFSIFLLTSATTAVSKHPFLRFAHKKQTFHLKPSALFMTNDWSVSRRVQIEEVGKEKEGGVWLRERARKGERRCS